LFLKHLRVPLPVTVTPKHHAPLFPGLVDQVAVPMDSGLPDNYN